MDRIWSKGQEKKHEIEPKLTDGVHVIWAGICLFIITSV